MPDRKADLAGDLLISLPDTPGFPLSRECSCAGDAPLTRKISAQPPPCHCEQSEAISSSGTDCFVTVVPRNDSSECWFFFRRNDGLCCAAEETLIVLRRYPRPWQRTRIEKRDYVPAGSRDRARSSPGRVFSCLNARLGTATQAQWLGAQLPRWER